MCFDAAGHNLRSASAGKMVWEYHPKCLHPNRRKGMKLAPLLGGIWVLFSILPSTGGLNSGGVFGEFEKRYGVNSESADDWFDYAVVKASPCDGKAYAFAIHRYWDDDSGCQAKIFKFDESGSDSGVEFINDATGGGFGSCRGYWPFSIDYEYVNDQCDISLVVKMRARWAPCADYNSHYEYCQEDDDQYYWIQSHYMTSSPYNSASLLIRRTWKDKGLFWGLSYLEPRATVVCDSAAVYHVYPSDDLVEFCLSDGNVAKCFSNDPPLQAGNCYADNGEHFYIGLHYTHANSNSAVVLRKFRLDGTDPSPVSEYYCLTGADEKEYESDVIIVDKGWTKEVVIIIGYDNSDAFSLARLDTDLNFLESTQFAGDGKSPFYPRLRYRPTDGFLLLNYCQGRYVRQISLFTLKYSSYCDAGDDRGAVSVSPNPASASVYAAFGIYSSGFNLFTSTLSVSRPKLSESLPDLHFYTCKADEFVFHSDYFIGVTSSSEIGAFHIREPSADFSFVHFNAENGTFTGTAPPSLLTGIKSENLTISEDFYVRAYSNDEVFTETSFTVYVHGYIAYRGTPIPIVSYENGRVVNTTVNLSDYFAIVDPPGFAITAVESNGLPEGVSMTVNEIERTIQFNGTIPGEVENCRNPYPIEVTLTDIYCNHTAQFVFETTKERPAINFDAVNETTHRLPAQAVSLGGGINIDVGNSFVEGEGIDRTIRYMAKLVDGSPLPSWLMFDPDTRMFSGLAPDSGCYDLDIEIIGLNDCGLDRSVYLGLSVTNEPPVFDESLSNITGQRVAAGDKGFFSFDSKCFINEESPVEGPLRFGYRTKVGERDVANPRWLRMADTGGVIRFEYDVPSVCENYSIEVYGYDTCQLNPPAVSSPFFLNVTNKAPVVMNPIGGFTIKGGEYFNVSLPSDTFRDPEGFSLAYQALQVNDETGEKEELPFYIRFDPDTLSFSGECNTGENETIHVVLEATDGCEIVREEFNIYVLYLPSTPTPTPPPASSYAGVVITILGTSLGISIAIGIGAFGFKAHRKVVEVEKAIEFAKEAKSNKENSNAKVILNFATAGGIGSEEESEFALKDLDIDKQESSDHSSISVSEGMDNLINVFGLEGEQ